MTLPCDLDIAIQSLLKDSIDDASVPVSKSMFVPSYDMDQTPNGFVYFDIDEMVPEHSSEGMAEEYDREVITFTLDVACAAHSNTQRKKLAGSVLDSLQPRDANRRTQLTSTDVRSSGIFVNYLRLTTINENSVLKTGQSTPDLTILVLSFSGKATC